MTDNTDEAEELLQEAQEQRRHTSEAPTAGDTEPDLDTVEAIKEALLAVEDGDTPENINIRDARLKALAVALQDAGELETTVSELNNYLDYETNVDAADATQSDLARLLIRVGLQEALPGHLEDAQEARQLAIEERSTGF